MTQITAGPGKFQSCLKFPPSVHLSPGEHCVSDLQLKREDTLRFKVFPKKASLGAGWKRRRPASDGWCLGEFELRGVNLVFDGEPAHDY